MRFFLLLLAFVAAARGATPPALAEALRTFRADAPPGWSYKQTTSAEGRSTVELCDAAKPEFERWTLLQKNGRPPTADELKEYTEARSRRSRAGTAPKLVEQLDLTTLETLNDGPDRATFRCRLRRGESRDDTSLHLRATLVVHKPSQTLESIELGNTEPFQPTLGVKIAELKTTMVYSLPMGERPSLPEKVTTRVRGRAFWLKSLDADMTVTFADYTRPTKKTDRN